ncbi:MAG TPA: GLPGLI family protein, partial [Ohtaekwangia sp.]|uniref:GLPGLI family protein n=1 Tax=Ohtaekwangia sp. TaxID=2066019 RepID=UPI002F94F665
GIITYEVKVNMHRRLPPDREQMKETIPEYNIHQDQLVFNTNESLYKPIEEEDDEFADEGGGVRMRFRRPNAEFYFDQASSRRIMLQEFMGKKYLIEDSIKITPWKFGAEVKTIKGYECRQASYYNEERKQNIVAWYTTALRPFIGPENFNTLPGAVIQVDINDGERIITLQKLEARALKKGELKIPSGGTKITEKEFRKMMQEQMQRMGRDGTIIIRN